MQPSAESVPSFVYDPETKKEHKCIEYSHLPGGKVDYNSNGDKEYVIGDELEFRSIYKIVEGPFTDWSKIVIDGHDGFIRFDGKYWAVKYK